MIKKIYCTEKNLERKVKPYANIMEGNNDIKRKTVTKILAKLKKNGDSALLETTNKLDNNTFKNIKEIIVSKKEIKEAKYKCSKSFLSALNLAIKRVSDYQKKLKPNNLIYKDKLGIKLGCIWNPINSCGLYVPGGKAFYPSSVIMNGVPAKLAGVKRLIIATPAYKNIIRPEILAAAEMLEIEEVYKIGGSQAVGAMTYGTETIKKVDKIVGPGNFYVAEAKKQVFGLVGIDSVAGPSEIMIIADKYSNPEWLAIDLLSQAEHDEEARAILVTDDKKLADDVEKSISKFLKKLSRNKIASESIKKNGLIIIIPKISLSYLVANLLAPEHLEVIVKNKKQLIKNIKNAGAIFAGRYSPEALGDYVAGPSHVLPTGGNARFESGLSILDFLKRTSYIEANKKGFAKLYRPIEVIANSEGLDAHAKSATIRFLKRK